MNGMCVVKTATTTTTGNVDDNDADGVVVLVKYNFKNYFNI